MLYIMVMNNLTDIDGWIDRLTDRQNDWLTETDREMIMADWYLNIMTLT